MNKLKLNLILLSVCTVFLFACGSQDYKEPPPPSGQSIARDLAKVDASKLAQSPAVKELKGNQELTVGGGTSLGAASSVKTEESSDYVFHSTNGYIPQDEVEAGTKVLRTSARNRLVLFSTIIGAIINGYHGIFKAVREHKEDKEPIEAKIINPDAKTVAAREKKILIETKQIKHPKKMGERALQVGWKIAQGAGCGFLLGIVGASGLTTFNIVPDSTIRTTSSQPPNPPSTSTLMTTGYSGNAGAVMPFPNHSAPGNYSTPALNQPQFLGVDLSHKDKDKDR